jgi:hypothetical protein
VSTRVPCEHASVYRKESSPRTVPRDSELGVPLKILDQTSLSSSSSTTPAPRTLGLAKLSTVHGGLGMVYQVNPPTEKTLSTVFRCRRSSNGHTLEICFDVLMLNPLNSLNPFHQSPTAREVLTIYHPQRVIYLRGSMLSVALTLK